MADNLRDAVQHFNGDARKLWLPVGAVMVVIFMLAGGLVGAGMWIARVGDRAASTTELASGLDNVNDKLANMTGRLDALMSMQATVAQTSAEVGALKSQMNAMETRLQSQDAWIQTTRGRLIEQGFQAPHYSPGGS